MKINISCREKKYFSSWKEFENDKDLLVPNRLSRVLTMMIRGHKEAKLGYSNCLGEFEKSVGYAASYRRLGRRL